MGKAVACGGKLLLAFRAVGNRAGNRLEAGEGQDQGAPGPGTLGRRVGKVLSELERQKPTNKP